MVGYWPTKHKWDSEGRLERWTGHPDILFICVSMCSCSWRRFPVNDESINFVCAFNPYIPQTLHSIHTPSRLSTQSTHPPDSSLNPHIPQTLHSLHTSPRLSRPCLSVYKIAHASFTSLYLTFACLTIKTLRTCLFTKCGSHKELRRQRSYLHLVEFWDKLIREGLKRPVPTTLQAPSTSGNSCLLS